MRVVKPHLLASLSWIWHLGLKFIVLPAAKGHCCEVLNSRLSKAIAKGWGAALLLDADLQHADTDHFAPTRRLCRCYWTLFGYRTKDRHFWNKNRGLKSVWCLPIVICTGFFGACTHQAEQVHGQVPAPSLCLESISQFPLRRPKASISELSQ